jgi:hypothetical protein
MNHYEPVYIVSPCHSSNTKAENDLAVHLVSKGLWLFNIPFKLVTGVYNGSEEESFVLLKEQFAINIAREYNQECYLFVDANRFCTLRDKNGKDINHLGILKSSKEKPKGDYTFDSINNLYYTV